MKSLLLYGFSPREGRIEVSAALQHWNQNYTPQMGTSTPFGQKQKIDKKYCNQ